MNTWFVVRRNKVFTVEDSRYIKVGLRYGNEPASRAEARERAEKLATTAARKASGGRKGNWYVDKVNDDTYVVRKKP